MSVAVAILSVLIAAGPVGGPQIAPAVITEATQPAAVIGEGTPTANPRDSDTDHADPLDDPFTMNGAEHSVAAPHTGAEEEHEEVLPRWEVSDPARTQLMLSPSAHTLREDESRISVTQFLVYQYNYGLTDDLQLGINSFFIAAASVDLKWRFLQTESFSASALVGGGALLIGGRDFGVYGRLVGTWQGDSLEASLGWSSLVVPAGDPPVVGSAMGALAWQVGRRTKLIAEYNASMELAEYLFDDVVHSLVWGPRFFWESFAVTPGYLTPLVREAWGDGFVGFPYLDVSYSF